MLGGLALRWIDGEGKKVFGVWKVEDFVSLSRLQYMKV